MTLIPDLHAMTERFNREVIGLPIPDRPTRLAPRRRFFAHEALLEELTEFVESTTLEGDVDALLDLVYFALGRIVEMGVAPGPVFEVVHAANMRKERGTLSKRPNSLGHDAVKPDGWEPPDLGPLLELRLRDLEASLLLKQLRQLGELDAAEHIAVPRRFPKVLVLGHARHGKDTVGAMLREMYGMRFTSSSEFCAGRVIMPAIGRMWDAWRGDGAEPDRAPEVPEYGSVAECFEDRINHRAFWFDTISAYTAEDPARLGREILAKNDVYCGVRRREELLALRDAGLVDLAVWVDRSDHLPPEPRSSCTVDRYMADVVVDNNGSLDQLRRQVADLFLDGHKLIAEVL